MVRMRRCTNQQTSCYQTISYCRLCCSLIAFWRKELYGYATDYFRVRGRKGPSRASYIRSTGVFKRWPRFRVSGQRQAWTSSERGRQEAHIRDDEKALGGKKKSCQSSLDQ